MLAVAETASLDDVKKAYRLVAKRNHPDLFPEGERTVRFTRMASINEAYRVIVQNLSVSGPRPRTSSQKTVSPDAQTPKTAQTPKKTPVKFDPLAPALPRDPGYVYYKRGCVLFAHGRKALLQRYNGRRLDFTNLTSDVLKLAVSSLGYFHKAYEHFRQVVEQHPDSIWVRDSELKMYFLRRYDVIYRRICENMRRQLKPATQ
jgi:hypothetical protein